MEARSLPLAVLISEAPKSRISGLFPTSIAPDIHPDNHSAAFNRGFMLRRLSYIVRPVAALAAALLFLSATGFGQLQPAPAGIGPAVADSRNVAASAALPPEVRELRREGHEALYNLDAVTAMAKFEEIRRLTPHHPAGDLYLATM